ncbi:MAG: class I SAM-dependent methyltransferase [Bdellovibrionota bacterium]|nr:class I SAM-dependent methyltransferase [Bdellovibrionota bacterium]
MKLFLLTISLFLFSCSHTKISKRDKWQKPNKIFKAISSSNDKNKTFCDLGSGSGYFTLNAAKKYKHIYASEINKKEIEKLSKNIERSRDNNITIIQSKVDDPLFPAGKCDVIFIALVYHHIENRVDYLQNLRRYLSENGKIVNLDNAFNPERYVGTGKRLPAKECRFPKEKFLKEAKLAKFSKSKEHFVLPMQYLIEIQ